MTCTSTPAQRRTWQSEQTETSVYMKINHTSVPTLEHLFVFPDKYGSLENTTNVIVVFWKVDESHKNLHEDILLETLFVDAHTGYKWLFGLRMKDEDLNAAKR